MFLPTVCMDSNILLYFVVTYGKWDSMDAIFGVGHSKYKGIHFLDLRNEK